MRLPASSALWTQWNPTSHSLSMDRETLRGAALGLLGVQAPAPAPHCAQPGDPFAALRHLLRNRLFCIGDEHLLLRYIAGPRLLCPAVDAAGAAWLVGSVLCGDLHREALLLLFIRSTAAPRGSAAVRDALICAPITSESVRSEALRLLL